MKKGNLRESFFISQASTCGQIHASAQADFILEANGETTEIEIGGPSKGNRQIKGSEDAVVFKDGIEMGFSRQIPLYLAGFLY